MQTEPQKEHQWLQQLVGEWTYEAEATMELGQPPSKFEGSERVLTLNAEGPDFAVEGKMAQYRDVIEFTSEDHRVLTSHRLGDDGEWHGFMRANYRRLKSP